MSVRAGLALGLVLFVMLFVVQNAQVVEVRFLFWSFRASLAIALFVALVAGILIGWLAARYRS